MSIDDEIFQRWLFSSESDSLDFKSSQYRFTGATDEDKSELLKDILAMANSWCATDAYIVIGIEDKADKPNREVGITDHVDDAVIQQFVNSKTNSVLQFQYLTHSSNNKTFGIIRVPRQSRPIYLKRGYSRLAANTVYVRRGSSTAVANPTEIALMGQGADVRQPDIEATFFDSVSGKSIGDVVTTQTTWIRVLDDIPDYKGHYAGSMFSVGIDLPNRDYYRELIEHAQFEFSYSKLKFCIKNNGDVEAINIKVELEFPMSVKGLLTDGDEVYMPDSSLSMAIRHPIAPSSHIHGFYIQQFSDRWVASAHLGGLHAKRVIDIDHTIYLQTDKSQTIPIVCRVYYDGASVPRETDLKVDAEVNIKEGNWVDFKRAFDGTGTDIDQ